MTCRDAAASLDDFVDGSLPLARRQALANHLHECATCTQALKEVRCTRRLLRRLPSERMPDPMKNRLLDELRKSRRLPDSAPPESHSDQPPHSARPAAAADDPHPSSAGH
jgi:anti-sigma factor RsiW